jgi:hypothetical protein
VPSHLYRQTHQNNRFLNRNLKSKEGFQALKENNCKPRLFYSAKLSFIIEGEIKTFHDKQKCKKFMATKPLRRYSKESITQTEDED